jgi:hypothetical protein
MALQGSSRNNLISLNNKGNNTLMGLNVMLHASESDLNTENLYGEPVICISVIDESNELIPTVGSPQDAQRIESDWNSFRATYPNRPFYLLQPIGTVRSGTGKNNEKSDVLIPPGVDDTDPVGVAPDYGLFYSEVNRDNKSTSSLSDWFTICGLSTYPVNTLISLFIDTSGSMTLSTVQASYDKFLTDCADAGLVIAGNSFNEGERWAVDHNKTFSDLLDLITITRTLDETVPFYNDGIFIEALQDSLVDKKIGNDLERFPNLYGYMGQKGRNSSLGTITITNPDGTLSINNSFMRGEITGSATKTNWVNNYYSNVNTHTINVCDTTLNQFPDGGRLINPDPTGFNSADVHGNIASIFTTPSNIDTQLTGFFGTVISSLVRRECYTLIITNSKEQLDGPPDLLADSLRLNVVNEPVVCISVIDESNQLVPNVGSPEDAQQIEADWNSFRSNYPNRPFYLLQPIETGYTKSDVLIPSGVDDTAPLPGLFYSQVSRDEGDDLLVSDWFTICGLSTYPVNTLISLFIDTSGSMKLSTVQASYDKFLTDCADAGLVIAGNTQNKTERWVEPHNLSIDALSNLILVQNDSRTLLEELDLRRYRVIALSGYQSTDGYDGVLFYGNDYTEPYAYITFTGTNTNDYTITRSATPPNWIKHVNQLQDTLTIAEQTKGGLFKSSNVYGVNDYRKPFAEVISQFMEDTLN